MVTVAVVIATIITGTIATVFVGHQYYNNLCGIPCVSLERLHKFAPEQGSILYDRHGNELGLLYRHHRRVIELSNMPQYLIQAFIDTEDRIFYEHKGVHYKRVLGAALNNLLERRYAEGFSTITMQLARNLYPELLPATEKSLRRKFMEVRIAKDIEREFSKKEILKTYLNAIYLGAGAYGVEAAAQIYFGKPASQLTLAEAALIAGLAKAPSEYNPYNNPQKAIERRNTVLRLMEQTGSISAEEAQGARQESLTLAYRSIEEAHAAVRVPASHFIEEVRRSLDAQLGDILYNGGLRIYTTLDPLIQSQVEDAVRTQAANIDNAVARAAQNDTVMHQIEGAMIVMDASTGDVLAMVGGRDFMNSQFNRATQARRQPGSAFKPFVYGAAIEAECSPLDTVNNGYLQMFVGADAWAPNNFTKTEIERGIEPITLREALRSSQNRATVRISEAVGLDSVIAFARRLGISSPLPRVPSVALGSASVKMLELIEAYSALAREDGAKVKPRFITHVEDGQGKVLVKNAVDADTVVSPAVTYILRAILQDAVDNGTGRPVRQAGYFGPAAGKTGTTNNAADVWFIGVTPQYVAGVWFGYDQPMLIDIGERPATGGNLAAPVWAEVIKAIQPPNPDSTQTYWLLPEGVDTVEMKITLDSPMGHETGSFLAQDTTNAPYAILDHQSNDEIAIESVDSVTVISRRQPRSICDIVFSQPRLDSLGNEFVWVHTLRRSGVVDSIKVDMFPAIIDSTNATQPQAISTIGDEMAEPPSI